MREWTDQKHEFVSYMEMTELLIKEDKDFFKTTTACFLADL